MTVPAAPLYMMTRRDIRTGDTEIVFGHTNAELINEVWESYVDNTSTVEIQRIMQGSMMNTPRPTTTLDHVKAERDQLRAMVEDLLTADEGIRRRPYMDDRDRGWDTATLKMRKAYETLRENPQLNF